MTLVNFLQVLVSGLALGGIYTLMAKGLFITNLTSNALNFGLGDFLMIASYVALSLVVGGLPIPAVFVLTLGTLALLGALLERVAVRPLNRRGLRDQGVLSWVLTTAGFGLILQNTAVLVWGTSNQSSPPLFSQTGHNVVTFMGVRLFVEEAVVGLVSLGTVALLYWYLFRTRSGKAITAVAFNRETAALLGIPVNRVIVTSYVLMGLLAGISGILAGPITTLHVHMGLAFTLKGFAVASIGGFVNPFGILIGGVLFGVIEAFCNYFDSAFGDLYPFLLILLLLIVKPSGLFGEAKADVR